MSYPSFVIFKVARQFQAGYIDLRWDVKTFIFRERDYQFVGQCVHYCQITDEKNQLVGFILNRLTNDVTEPFLLTWFDNAENGEDEGGMFHFFIRWPCPEKWENDCSLLIGANVFHDGKGDFLITIPDAKANDEGGRFQNLWSKIAFPLTPSDQFCVKKYFPKRENY